MVRVIAWRALKMYCPTSLQGSGLVRTVGPLCAQTRVAIYRDEREARSAVWPAKQAT